MDEGNEKIHGGHRERLRERFAREGLDGFAAHQILELLLFHALPRADTNPIAHQLLRRFGGLAAVLEADPRDLETVAGIGRNAALFLTLIPQVTRRYLRDRLEHDRPCLDNAQAVADYLIPLMAGRAEEVFYVLCLDTKCRMVYPALISQGTVKDTFVHPRVVVEEAIRHRAAAVILAHNHPSGNASPSREDHALTRDLVRILRAIDIPVLDHIIVAGGEVHSFARAGQMPDHKAL
jgi:DNA repair protein RadC